MMRDTNLSRKLNIRKTALIKISGKSGSGKSTLIRKLIGLVAVKNF